MCQWTACSQRLRAPWPSLQAEQMSTDDDRYETPKRRTVVLLICFALLVGVGSFTVLRPEIEDEPSDDATRQTGSSEAGADDATLQE